MVTNVLIVAIVVLIAATINLVRERRRIEALLADNGNIYIYLAPESGLAPSLDVYSEEVLAQKENAQWN